MSRLFSLLLVLALFSMAGVACAMPGASGGMGGMDAARASFNKADTNKDENLTKEEFMAAFSGMKDEAFAAIDTDKDGKISRQEWQNFAINHSMGRSGQGSGMPPKAAPAPNALPMVTPPAK